MRTAPQVAQAVEALEREREDRQEPADQRVVGVVMADVLEARELLLSLNPWFSTSRRLLVRR